MEFGCRGVHHTYIHTHLHTYILTHKVNLGMQSLKYLKTLKIISYYYVFRFLWNEEKFSGDFNVVGSSFQMLATAMRKARLPRLSLVLGTESCSEEDDLKQVQEQHG